MHDVWIDPFPNMLTLFLNCVIFKALCDVQMKKTVNNIYSEDFKNT